MTWPLLRLMPSCKSADLQGRVYVKMTHLEKFKHAAQIWV